MYIYLHDYMYASAEVSSNSYPHTLTHRHTCKSVCVRVSRFVCSCVRAHVTKRLGRRPSSLTLTCQPLALPQLKQTLST